MRTWDAMPTCDQIKAFRKNDPRIPPGWEVPAKLKKPGTPWELLSPSTRHRLYHQGDPRVPSSYQPVTIAQVRHRPASVVVPLTPFLLDMSERDLWDFLKTSWTQQGIDPQNVTFRTPSGQNLITLPVP